jgi:gamma-glutamyl hercynylcysteine S-oxide synthase
LATRASPSTAIVDLMKRMKGMTARPLSSFSKEWRSLPQQMIDSPRAKAAEGKQQGMIKLPEADFRFKVNGIEIEGAEVNGADVQYPWEASPRLFHDHIVHIPSFWIDKYPVTNAQFKSFLDTTQYKPRDSYNFLRDWKDGKIPSGWENKPVTWVSREDAQAYAKWAGKRLPREWEWQYAAQGTDGRLYPWGENWEQQRVPVVDHGRTMRGPDDVGSHPQGASPFGVEDLVGNVWQWTDEFVDDHSRSAIVRGGSYYQPQYSMWYFPQAYKLSHHGRYLLMSPSMDRSGAIGFRCAVDAT